MANLPIDSIKKLYYDEQLSAREVAERLGITQWVVFKFMKRLELPRRKPEESNAINFNKKPLSFSIKNDLSPDEEKLKIAGLMLYWAEGAKFNPERRNCTVDFANSNPEMICAFLKFLREICRVDETHLRVYIYCHANQNIEAVKDFWHNATKIPLSQFTKPFVRHDFLSEKSGKMKYGLAHIRYADKKLLIQIDNSIKQYVGIFLNKGVSDSSNSTSL